MAGTPKHGLSYTPEYRAWQQMRLRCLDPGHAAYADYGGRGITVCDRWKDSPVAFLADMGPKPSPAHELDRHPNNDGNYEPGNCRWALRKDNCRNRRSNRFVEYRGRRLTLAEWCEQLDISADTIAKRLDAGWTAERAFETPVRAKAPNGQAKGYTRPCIDCGDPAHGTRCRPCENGRRPRDGMTGAFVPVCTGTALCAALLENA